MVADRCVTLHIVSCAATILIWFYATQVASPGDYVVRYRLHASLLWLGILYWAWALLMALVYETQESNDANIHFKLSSDDTFSLPLYVNSLTGKEPLKIDKSTHQISKGVHIEQPLEKFIKQERATPTPARDTEMTSPSKPRDLRDVPLDWGTNGALTSALALSCVVYVWAVQGSAREILYHFWLHSWGMNFRDQMMLMVIPVVMCVLEVITALLYLLQLLGCVQMDPRVRNLKLDDDTIVECVVSAPKQRQKPVTTENNAKPTLPVACQDMALPHIVNCL